MQKINSIHKLIVKIQQILESHELNGYAHFSSSSSFLIIYFKSLE